MKPRASPDTVLPTERPAAPRAAIAVCALLALCGGGVFVALTAIRISLLGAAACGLAVTLGGAWLLAARRGFRDARIGFMLGFSFAFVVLEWPFLVLLALAVLKSPSDWG